MLGDALAAFSRTESPGVDTEPAPPTSDADMSRAVPGGNSETILRLRLRLVENEVRTLQALTATLASPYDSDNWRNWANVAQRTR